MMTDYRIPPTSVAGQAGNEVVWTVVQRLCDDLWTSSEADPQLGQVTAGQRAVYSLHRARVEIGNGGIAQYFWNSDGSLVRDAIEGARLLGADDYASILCDAVALVFPTGEVATDRLERQERVDGLSDGQHERLTALEDRFFARLHDPHTTLARYYLRYIQRHPTEFFLEA
jgi:Domain of unknown function (DUF4375)